MTSRPLIFPTKIADPIIRGILKGNIDSYASLVGKVSHHANVAFLDGSLCNFRSRKDNLIDQIVCPFGKVGDRLYVRECTLVMHQGQDVVYRADMDSQEAAGFGAMYGGWKAPGQMLRQHCRINLEITELACRKLEVNRVGNVSSSRWHWVVWFKGVPITQPA